MVKQGDIVRYKVNGIERNAIVLSARDAEADHLGANGEPTLHLLFIAPEREASQKDKAGYIPSSFVEYDVVHASHEFSDEYKRAKGLQTQAQIAAVRGSGEWTEVVPPASVEYYSDAAEAIEQLPAEVPAKEPKPKKWGK